MARVPLDAKPPGRRFLLGCFGVAFLLIAILCAYIVIGHRNAVGPYRPPPAQRP